MRKTSFVEGEYYHVFSRTLLKTPFFKDVKNSKRLHKGFWMANSDNSVEAFQFLRNHPSTTTKEVLEIIQDGNSLVSVLCYAIMPDHYHLLVREKTKNGISEFVRKCNISISKYINIRNERKGPIFEGRFNSKHIDSNEYLLHLSCYIHLNPLDFLVGREWRNHNLKNWSLARKKLLDYPWSSVRSFLEEKEKDLVVSDYEIILDQFKNKKEYESFLRDWLEVDQNNLTKIKNYV